MERRECRSCGQPMTLIITHDTVPGESWKACYTCLRCGHKIAGVQGRSRAEAEKRLGDFVAMIDKGYEAADKKSAEASIKLQSTEADRALKTYGLYCRLCETLTGKTIAKLDELLTAAQKAKRELAAYEGAGQRYEAEIARLKEMATEDILLAARNDYPCDSCVNNTLDVRCDCDNCTDCEHHCVCYECHDNESYVWRGGK